MASTSGPSPSTGTAFQVWASTPAWAVNVYAASTTVVVVRIWLNDSALVLVPRADLPR